MSLDFADGVAKLCYDKFKKLPQTGKPQTNKEWTLLAGIIASFDDPDKNLKVITLCTGTKCLGIGKLVETALAAKLDLDGFSDGKTVYLHRDFGEDIYLINPKQPGFEQNIKCGNILFDSHAEVLARRAFVKYIYREINLILYRRTSEVIAWCGRNKKFKIRPGIKFHLFISHVPCGDAAIFPKETEKHGSPLGEEVDKESDRKTKKAKTEILEMNPPRESSTEELEKLSELDVLGEDKIKDNFSSPLTYEVEDERNKITKAMTESLELISPVEKSSEKQDSLSKSKNFKQDEIKDIHRTGAKCVENGLQDPKGPGINYHVTGAVRTKPGRGSPTWSMSCSDKIALWNVCGVQGALLSLVLSEPLYFSSIVFGKCSFNKEALERAVIGRIAAVSKLPPHYKVNKPEILQSSMPFEFSKETVLANSKKAELTNKITPNPASIIWCDNYFHNVLIVGRKQGVTKKNLRKKASRSDVCKSELFESFIHMCCHDSLRPHFPVDYKKTYLDYKRSAEPYNEAKAAVQDVLHGWKKKPDKFQNFLAPAIPSHSSST